MAATDLVRQALNGVARGAPVVLAVSGGRDSVGMAALTTAARPDLRATVGHVRHGLRSDAADAAAARSCARRLGLPAEVVSVTVTESGQGLEAAARTARYEALATLAASRGATAVLTGHTADDQSETVLLNIARGSGLPGLAGMATERPLAAGVVLVRPLLGVRRAVVRAAAAGFEVVDDPTNTDPAQRRSRARHRLLPLLSELTGNDSDPVQALARLAEHARRDTDALDRLADEAAAGIVSRWGPLRCLDTEALARLQPALSTRLVRRAVQDAAGAGSAPPPAATVERLLALTAGERTTVGGRVRAEASGRWLVVAPDDELVLDTRFVDETTVVTELDLLVRRDCDGAGVLPPWAPVGAATTVAVAAGDLVVRAREPGDRVRSAGGTRRVAEAMVDAGVPRLARTLVPVFTDRDGPVWVPGVAVRRGMSGRPLRLAAVNPAGGPPPMD